MTVKSEQFTEVHSLHERAIEGALRIVARNEDHQPSLQEIADEIGVSREDLLQIFPDSQVVLAAIAEQALIRLLDICVKSVVKVDPNDAVAQFAALGEAYLDWSMANSSEFRLIGDSRLIRLSENPNLSRYTESIRDLMRRLLERAKQAGHLRENEDIELLVLTSYTFAYGLSRMIIDGRIADWYPNEPAVAVARRALADFIRRIARGSYSATRSAARSDDS